MKLRAETLYVDKNTGEMGLAFQDSDDGGPIHKVYFDRKGVVSCLGVEDTLRKATYREEQDWRKSVITQKRINLWASENSTN